MMIVRSPESIRNEVVMLRSLHKGAFLLVEGETDVHLFENFSEKLECRLVPVDNKDNATKCIKLLENQNFAGVLAVVDADFDILEGRSSYGDNVVLTDCHDIETMIISSEAFDRFLDSFVDVIKFVKCFGDPQGSSYGMIVRGRLTAMGREVGYFRWFSLRNSMSLKFREIDFERYIDAGFAAIAIEKLVKDLVNECDDSQYDQKTVQQGIKSLVKTEHDVWMVCCGHDLTKILLAGLSKFGDSEKIPNWDVNRLERVLRGKYHWNNLVNTKMFNSMIEWEKRNIGFRVFKS